MKRLFHFNIKKNILVLMMIVCLCPILSVSYATFVFNTEEYRASEMYIGKLLYGIKINNEAVSEITISPGSHEIIVEVTSLNTISTNYKLVYETNDNIVVRYANDENTPTYGLITTTKFSTLLITNISEEDITVKFNIVGGYKTNELSEITIPESYSEIITDYTKYDFNAISMYVGNERVESLDNEKMYNLVDYSCTNGESVTWDKNNYEIAVKPLTDQTKCELYFEDISDTLYARILLDNEESSDKDIDFSQISSDTNGKGLYYTSDLSLTEDYDGDGAGERVYYYRGAVTNNNVIFGGYCWRIVRTNEDGSVKLRYNGTYENGTCPVTGTAVKINNENYRFNAEYDDPKYNEYIRIDGSGDSDIKEVIDAWYTSSGLSNYEDKIANVPYCADKTNPINPTTGSYTLRTFYGAANRLFDITTLSTKSDAEPIYKCIDESGKHTVSGDDWGGTGLLTHPIGLLTADEVAYAGVTRSDENTSCYLSTSSFYWLISPVDWDSSAAHAGSFGINSISRLGHFDVDDGVVLYELGALPAVSLRPEVTVSSTGDGSYTNPYVVN